MIVDVHPAPPHLPPAANGGGPPPAADSYASEPASELVRWAQSTLNQLLRLRLPVDGIMSPETRDAISDFQRRQGLPVDGIIGPDTQAALVAARKAHGRRSPNQREVAADVFEQPTRQFEVGRPRIEDRTHLADKSQRKGRRDPMKVDAVVLHQMACCHRRKEGGYDRMGSHFAILRDGRILQLHPVEAKTHASNGFNSRSVAVEFAGNFPNMRGKCWNSKEHGCMQLNQAQVDAGRYLIGHLRKKINLKYVFAHRQSSATRSNDPGPDIWYNVGQWAIDKYGLSDGGSNYRVTYSAQTKRRIKNLGDGQPIPEEWRTWGRRPGATPLAGSAASGTAPSAAGTGGSLDFLTTIFGIPQAIVEALRRGQEQLALRTAIAQGEQSENKLTNLIFFARHPDRRGRKLAKGEPGFQRLAAEWMSIRDRLVRPVLQARTKPPRKRTSTSRMPAGVNPKTVANIDRFSRLIDSIAPQFGVDPNTVRGIIAAESAGNPDSGKSGGYKGLMQAGTGNEQLEPANSIRSGVKKYLEKKRSVTAILKKYGINLNTLYSGARIKYIMTAYNAGQGTLKKALEYARAAGDASRWMEQPYYQRALFYYGAYSVRAPFNWCLKKLPPQTAAEAMATLTGASAATLLRDYYRPGKGWDIRSLQRKYGERIISRLRAERKRLRKDNSLTVAKARQVASPLLFCSAEFKHTHLAGYLNKILAYKRYYDGR